MKSVSSPASKPTKRRVILRIISVKKKARKRKAKRNARGRRVQRAKGKVKHSTRMRIALPEGAFATSALVRDGFISGNNGGGG